MSSCHPPIMMPNVSPVPIPNASQEYQGWCIDALGIFVLCQLDYKSVISCLSCWAGSDFVEEIVSDKIDQSLWGIYTQSKFTIPYSTHYYLGIFDMYAILNKSLSPPPAGLHDAIRSCPQFDDVPGVHNYPPEFEGFPTGFRHWLRCFVCPILLPIPYPLPLPSLSHPSASA